ncbi:MAG: hypothetical protein ACRECM_01305, partial [Methyloceanibacter sp.]
MFIPPAQQRLQPQPARAGSSPPEAPSPEEIEAITRVQSCLTELGYYKGAIDGKRGKETWTAYWHFKHDHGLGAYSDILAEPVRQKLDSLCKLTEQTAALEPTTQPLDRPEVEAAPDSPGSDGEESVALASPESDESDGEESVALASPESDSVALEPRVRLDIDCLPEDLIALLQRAHGPGVAVKSCERACLPSPKGLPQAELDELQKNTGVVWCRACVPIQGQLTLDDVRRIERAGNVQLCATPPQQLPRHESGAGDGLRSYTRVRELYRALPPAAEDPDAVAVIIGNRSYAKLPPSVTSYNDADAIYSVLTEHLGYRPDNILD